MQRGSRIVLGEAGAADLAPATELRGFGLRAGAGETDRAKLVELRADLVKLCAQGGDLAGVPLGKLVQFVAHASEHRAHAFLAVEQLATVTHDVSANLEARRRGHGRAPCGEARRRDRA